MHTRCITKTTAPKADSFSPVVSKIQEVVTLADSAVILVGDAKSTVSEFISS